MKEWKGVYGIDTMDMRVQILNLGLVARKKLSMNNFIFIDAKLVKFDYFNDRNKIYKNIILLYSSYK